MLGLFLIILKTTTYFVTKTMGRGSTSKRNSRSNGRRGSGSMVHFIWYITTWSEGGSYQRATGYASGSPIKGLCINRSSRVEWRIFKDSKCRRRRGGSTLQAPKAFWCFCEFCFFATCGRFRGLRTRATRGRGSSSTYDYRNGVASRYAASCPRDMSNAGFGEAAKGCHGRCLRSIRSGGAGSSPCSFIVSPSARLFKVQCGVGRKAPSGVSSRSCGGGNGSDRCPFSLFYLFLIIVVRIRRLLFWIRSGHGCELLIGAYRFLSRGRLLLPMGFLW